MFCFQQLDTKQTEHMNWVCSRDDEKKNMGNEEVEAILVYYKR
jgi:hypothetical protein